MIQDAAIVVGPGTAVDLAESFRILQQHLHFVDVAAPNRHQQRMPMQRMPIIARCLLHRTIALTGKHQHYTTIITSHCLRRSGGMPFAKKKENLKHFASGVGWDSECAVSLRVVPLAASDSAGCGAAVVGGHRDCMSTVPLVSAPPLCRAPVVGHRR